MGLWLLTNQVAIANEVLTEKANTGEETSELNNPNSPATTMVETNRPNRTG